MILREKLRNTIFSVFRRQQVSQFLQKKSFSGKKRVSSTLV